MPEGAFYGQEAAPLRQKMGFWSQAAPKTAGKFYDQNTTCPNQKIGFVGVLLAAPFRTNKNADPIPEIWSLGYLEIARVILKFHEIS